MRDPACLSRHSGHGRTSPEVIVHRSSSSPGPDLAEIESTQVPARRSRRPALLAAAVAAIALVAGCSSSSGAPGAAGTPGTSAPDSGHTTAAKAVSVALAGATGSSVPWDHALTLSVTDGTLKSVDAKDADGAAVPGTVSGTTWTASGTLVPSTTYSLHATVTDSAGTDSTVDKTVMTTAAPKTFSGYLSPKTGAVVGVGQAIIIRFSKPIEGRAAKLAVEKQLTVTTSPSQPGAWRWYDSSEVHYHGPAYWKAHTKITVTETLGKVKLPGTSTWGKATPATSTFTIGDAVISTVDITAHNMVVRKNGKVIETFPVSTGRAKYPTKGGVHVVLTREKVHTYDSSTVGIPKDGPGGYYEMLPWSMRISNGGAFVHANPATVGEQGNSNVSHGCVNLSTTNAHTFYKITHIGDVVNIIHAVVAPVTSDAGMSDWNYSYTEWQKGNLDI